MKWARFPKLCKLTTKDFPSQSHRRICHQANFVHASTIKSKLQLASRKRMDTLNWCCSFIYASKSGNLERWWFVENVEADQSYFLAEVDNITRKSFEKNLAKIGPCSFAEVGGNDQIDASFVRLDPTHGFMLEKEGPYGERSNSPSGKNGLDDDHV